ncbi:MAG: hypothetical protein OEY62_05335, partial [Acidimicrobiia bacterium]|nr:hypothetical protein [Acidimicrobiia bacterium]
TTTTLLTNPPSSRRTLPQRAPGSYPAEPSRRPNLERRRNARIIEIPTAHIALISRHNDHFEERSGSARRALPASLRREHGPGQGHPADALDLPDIGRWRVRDIARGSE